MNRRELNPTALVSGLVFIVLGALFLLDRLDVLEISGGFVVPVLLVGLGIGILLGASRRERATPPAEPPRAEPPPTPPAEPRPEEGSPPAE